MTGVSVRNMLVDAERIAQVLADGWTYPAWIVGASRMREVDDGWPGPGSRLHHSVGIWPLVVDDTTVVVSSDLPRRLELDASAWPAGRARIVFELEQVDEGRTRVSMAETLRGPVAALTPEPVESRVMRWRNDEVLQRLEAIAARRRA